MRSLAAAIAVVVAAGCATPPPPQVETDPPPAPREFRAAWVATVANIDWPSRRDLSTDEQRREMLAILDRARELHLNAIILQVRPSADAIYPSALEPWSEYLTGEQGRAPQPAYDPLDEWIREAHARGIEIHAWFNPYRVRHAKAQSGTWVPPDMVRSYGQYLWFDPGDPAAVEHTMAVIRDIVRRYDIDGVHMDDYFYPYPVEGLEFPDDATWNAYVDAGGMLTRADWRRRNVDELVERIHREVRAEKPLMRFGVSPFGIGRPDKRPPGITGFSQYDSLYADVELWLQRCWVDYLAPQLYWPIDQAPQAFGVLLDYWIGENLCGRHIFPGLFTSRINDTPKTWQPAEIVNQVGEVRRRAGAEGHIHFSMAALSQNRAGINDALAAAHYASPALIPASPWIDHTPPAAPRLVREGRTLRVAAGEGKPVARWAVWTRSAGQWKFSVRPAAATTLAMPSSVDRAVISAVDRLGNESARVSIAIPAEIIPVATWGGIPAEAARARRHTIKRITLHHQGEPWRTGRDPQEYMRALQKWSREARGWLDIPYHYVIDLEGRIYEARHIDYAGDTNTDYDPAGHALVQVVGNFEDVEPNAAQLDAIVRIMAIVAERHGLTEDAIAGHRDYTTNTVCPGKNLYRYLENGWIRARVRERLAAERR